MIGFNKPYQTGNEAYYIDKAYKNNKLAGDGSLTRECEKLLASISSSRKCLLTNSCTAALEISALLCDIQSGDEVIMPSFTFVSTANAFVLRGAKPIFVDIRPDTLNIDEKKIEEQITTKTKAIVVVHYAGVSAEMDFIMKLGAHYKIPVIEDAAQGIASYYKDKALGSIGDLGTYSFHETKNVICGEGGALAINNDKYLERAEIIREKGTNRSKFFRGEVDKYTWCDVGSSFLPGEITAAFLLAQLKQAKEITNKRVEAWNFYYEAFESSENLNLARRPVIPDECSHNGHIFYLLLKSNEVRGKFIDKMNEIGINCVFHYTPLHNSPFAKQYLGNEQKLIHTESLAERLVRLPLWIGIDKYQDFIVESAKTILQTV